jgi:hypothetical protein
MDLYFVVANPLNVYEILESSLGKKYLFLIIANPLNF